MLQHNSHLAELAKRYGEEDTEATLIYLLGPGFEDMLQGSVGRQRGASRISGSGSSGSSSEHSGSVNGSDDGRVQFHLIFTTSSKARRQAPRRGGIAPIW